MELGKIHVLVLATAVGSYLTGLVAADSGPAGQAVAAVPTAVISELAWAGSSISASDEWIELHNPGPSPVDLAGWQITKGAPTEEHMITLPAGANISPGGFYVVSNFAASQSVLAVEPDLVDSAVTLSNTALSIRLYAGDWHDPALLVDTAGDGSAPPAGNNGLKISMERNDDWSGWHDAQASLNLDPGVVDVATPAAINSSPVVPPIVTSISPNSAAGGTQLSVEAIVGEHFVEPVAVQLVQSGAVIEATEVHLASANLIDAAIFDIPEDAGGSWNLVVTVGTGQTATLPAAVSIVPPATTPDLSTDIRLSEIHPRPATTVNDEFIELVNTGSKTVDLTGWQIDDIEGGGSAPFALTGTIPPAGFRVVYKPVSRITLNDEGDTVRLIQPSGMVLDSTAYPPANAGKAWARYQLEWQWTDTPTPNGTNIIHLVEDPAPDEQNDEDSQDDKDAPSYKRGSVVVDELLPNPLDGAKEFIELRNATDRTIRLDGWRLGDRTKRRFSLSRLSLAAGARLVIYDDVSGIALNDSGGDKVSLFDPNGSEISSLEYLDSAPVGAAFIRSESGPTWVTPDTPGKQNPTELVEIESEVGGWVSEVAADSLPVTGASDIPVLMTVWAVVAIMVWKFYGKNY